jgi:hypothetical protein
MKCRSLTNAWIPRLAVLLISLSPLLAFGHDPYEITTRVFLRTNSLEVRMTLAAGTAQLLLATNGSPSAPATQSDLEAVRPALTKCAAEFLRVSSAGQPLAVQETKMSFSVEDHVEFVVTYARPVPGLLRLEAVQFAKLPVNEPYGAVLTAVDLAHNLVLGQKLLTARDPAFEAKVEAPSSAQKSPQDSTKGAKP